MRSALSRRDFLKAASATSVAIALGPSRWGWAAEGSPFADLQDDLILRLPEGFSYKIIAETGRPLLLGSGTPVPRPQFPDLNVAFPMPDGKILLSTSHEIPSWFPVAATPRDDYDPLASGAVTSLLLSPDGQEVLEGAYNTGGMITNCSGSGSPWGTVLTCEEETTDMGAPHGYVWEVDPHKHTKVRLDDCGRFEHETAVVDPATGYVYLTEDAGKALLYRMRPNVPGDLRYGTLEAFAMGSGKGTGHWVTIDHPSGTLPNGDPLSPQEQGSAKGALEFKRLEGGRIDGRDFYFTETEDDTSCGAVWRLDTHTNRLEIWAQGQEGGAMCMPDNLAFDAAGNAFVAEDRNNATYQEPNRILFIDRRTGEIATFAEVPLQGGGEATNEPTGPEFSPDGRVLFLNLQRFPDFGVTLAITGPFAAWSERKQRAAAPLQARPAEMAGLSGTGVGLGAAALVALRRRGRLDALPGDLEDIAHDLGSPTDVPHPKRRPARP